LIQALLVAGHLELQNLRKGKRSLMTRVALAGQLEQSHRCCYKVLMNSFETTAVLQPVILQLSWQYPKNI